MPLVAAYSDSEDESDDNAVASQAPLVYAVQSKSNENNEDVYGPATSKSDEILEEFVKKVDYGEKLPERPKPASTLSSLRLKGRKSGRIQISIPDILGSDSDDEPPAPKMQKTSHNGLSGLIGSLPQPRNTVVGKAANRKLIPHSLNRPAAPSNATKKQNAASMKSKNTLLTDAYSDSDDGKEGPTTASTNFFSIDNGVTEHKPTSNFFEFEEDNENQAGPSHTISQPEYQAQPTAASLYNMAAQAEEGDGSSQNPAVRQEEDDGMQNILNSEEFLKMQGKKHRGREDIQLIDVNTDDLKSTEIELTKNLSQDVDPSMYEHRKTMNLSGQEKRKHQITYLAYQAKEREIELKNTWADNRHTKQQTQAKYGF